MDLNGNLGNTGIPTKIAIPLGAVVAFGGYHFIQQYRAGKAASTAATAASTTGSLASMPYGPDTGATDIRMATTNSGLGAGQYAALGTTANGVVAQNQTIQSQMNELMAMEIINAKGTVALMQVNPGMAAKYRALPSDSDYMKAFQAAMPTPSGTIPGGYGT